jgi:hypothetical protein
MQGMKRLDPKLRAPPYLDMITRLEEMKIQARIPFGHRSAMRFRKF